MHPANSATFKLANGYFASSKLAIQLRIYCNATSNSMFILILTASVTFSSMADGNCCFRFCAVIINVKICLMLSTVRNTCKSTATFLGHILRLVLSSVLTVT